ncbi:AAA family ATPase [Pseudovibrio ascidiaceicola]|uniref:AAA family ATPase n=1 Tax=Pseudovibrio ascidiaceicola TaxID=285279 RepID=UPI000D69A7BE|nr:AAA family ATPase [Pseudovibrio ascidiaceicola]
MTFRLLEVEFPINQGATVPLFPKTMFSSNKIVFREENIDPNDYATAQLSSSEQIDSNQYTVVIGKNGAGKSILLTAIITAFVHIKLRKDDPDTQFTTALRRLKYAFDEKIYEVNFAYSFIQNATCDAIEIDPYELPTPSNITAICNATHSRFSKLSNDLKQSNHPDDRKALDVLESFVHAPSYNKTPDSFSGFLTLLFNQNNNIYRFLSNKEKLKRVFNTLGYQPHLTYKAAYFLGNEFIFDTLLSNASSSSKLDRIRAHEDKQNKTKSLMGGSYKSSVLEHEDLDHLSELLPSLILRKNNKGYEYRAYFDCKFLDQDLDTKALEALSTFLRLGFLKVSDIEINRTDGGLISLSSVSSGELTMFSNILNVASSWYQNTLFLIDEPEVSLHPEWQESYVSILDDVFEDFAPSQFIFATHSPLVLSSLPAQSSTIVSLAGKKTRSIHAEDITKKSIDQLLIEAFGTGSNNNLFVKERVVKCLSMLTDNKQSTPAFQKLLKELEGILPLVPEDEGSREIIASLLALKSEEAND